MRKEAGYTHARTNARVRVSEWNKKESERNEILEVKKESDSLWLWFPWPTRRDSRPRLAQKKKSLSEWHKQIPLPLDREWPTPQTLKTFPIFPTRAYNPTRPVFQVSLSVSLSLIEIFFYPFIFCFWFTIILSKFFFLILLLWWHSIMFVFGCWESVGKEVRNQLLWCIVISESERSLRNQLWELCFKRVLDDF